MQIGATTIFYTNIIHLEVMVAPGSQGKYDEIIGNNHRKMVV